METTSIEVPLYMLYYFNYVLLLYYYGILFQWYLLLLLFLVELTASRSILGPSLGVPLSITAMICATAGILGFLIFYFKLKKKKYESLKENVYFSACKQHFD